MNKSDLERRLKEAFEAEAQRMGSAEEQQRRHKAIADRVLRPARSRHWYWRLAYAVRDLMFAAVRRYAVIASFWIDRWRRLRG